MLHLVALSCETLLVSRTDRFDHLAHGAVEPYKDGSRNDVMSYVEFGDLGHRCKRADIAISQSMTRGDDQTYTSCVNSRLAYTFYLSRCSHGALAMRGTGAESELSVLRRA